MKKSTSRNMLLVLLLSFFLFACSGNEGEQKTGINLQGEANMDVPASQVIELNSEQAAELNIETITAHLARVEFKLVVPGIIDPAPDGIAFLSSPVSGRLAKILVHEGENVRKGELLAELESLEYANLLSDFLQAQAQLSYTEKQMERLKTLVEQKISSQQDLERTQAEFDRINASVMSSQARLKAVGVTDKEIKAWQMGNKPYPNLKIRATLNGTVNDHFISLGQSVQPNENLLTIVNLSEILITGFVSPEDAPFIKAGNKVYLSQVTTPERTIKTTIKSIRPTLDPVNRAINVYALAAPINNWPTPGENVRLEIEAWTSLELISVPSSSMAYYGEQPIVFVEKSQNKFIPIQVKVFKEAPGMVILSSGLTEGDKVAINQVFSLKALLKYELFAE